MLIQKEYFKSNSILKEEKEILPIKTILLHELDRNINY